VSQDKAGLIDGPGTSAQAWHSWDRLARLPVADPARWRSAVILAAHPDDEVLGAGGTIALLAAAGARIRLVAVTDGEGSHPGLADPADLAERRAAETAAALQALGASAVEVIRLRFPDTRLAGMADELTDAVAGLTAGFEVCLAPWERDAHADHEAVGRAARQTGAEPWFYPVWMWHWAAPGDGRAPWHQAWQVRLSRLAAARKRAAIGCFRSQLEPRNVALGPVLTPGMIANFARLQEVFFR
jgi:LmbE family N-acetylglucosaminyl deacetylase